MIATTDLYWAAGFLEGEGCFYFSVSCAYVSAAQVQREPLERLQRILGGSIHSVKPQKEGWQPQFRWVAAGIHGAAIMMTLYALMSPKRRERILVAMAKWKAKPGVGRWRGRITHCPRGHRYTPENTSVGYRKGTGRIHRQCRTCQNAWLRAKRASDRMARTVRGCRDG